MIKKTLLLLYTLTLFCAAGFAQEPTVKVTYETLLERVKKQDPAADFRALRLAYTETKLYNPYGGDRETRGAMFAALNSGEYEKAAASSEKLLGSNYLDLNAHFVAFAAHKHLGRTEKAGFHKYVFDGLLKSITDSGDGKTMETAFIVISTDEEYTLFNVLGLRPSQQSLVNENGHHYDKMTVTDPKTNQTSTYYFNIDKPYGWLGKSLKQ